jgi:UDP-3-O-[3-hydroxymyristoyl] glucosamine N-acyltransferase
LAFVSNPRYKKYIATSSAGALLLDRDTPAPGHTVIRLADPYLAFAKALAAFHPQAWPSGGIDANAWVAQDADLGEGVRVEAFATIGSGAVIGAGSWIQAGSFVGPRARIGAACRLMPGSVVMDDCELGDRVWLNPGAIVGSEGFGFAPSPGGLVKIPQPGRTVVGSDVELGANSCVDRAAIGETVIGRGTKIDNLCQIGHGARLGTDILMVAYSGVAGSATLGDGVTLAARAGVLGHLEVPSGSTVTAYSCLTREPREAGAFSGMPARSHGQWRREAAALRALPDLLKEVRRLEQRVTTLENRLAEQEEK